jgi:hypothetical protein
MPYSRHNLILPATGEKAFLFKLSQSEKQVPPLQTLMLTKPDSLQSHDSLKKHYNDTEAARTTLKMFRGLARNKNLLSNGNAEVAL